MEAADLIARRLRARPDVSVAYLVVPAAAALVVMAAAPAAAQMLDTSATATDLALSMGIPAGQIVSATLRLPGDTSPDSRAYALATGALGSFFPREGDTYVILSTGDVAEIPGANDVPGQSTDLGIADGRGMDGGGDDFVRLTVVLDPPDTARSFHVQFAFYSEEYPEFVGSAFNDFFSLEAGGTNISFTGSTPVIPNNLVSDEEGKLVSVNSNFFIQDTNQTTGTEFDGSTELLELCAPIADPTQNLTLVFTVADVGDAILDSAIFLDHLRFDEFAPARAATVEILKGTLLGGEKERLVVITYPNPYRPLVDGDLTFAISSESCFSSTRFQSIRIYTFDGRLVHDVRSASGLSCAQTACWSGRNDAGNLVASGTYRYRVETNDGRSATGRFTLVK